MLNRRHPFGRLGASSERSGGSRADSREILSEAKDDIKLFLSSEAPAERSISFVLLLVRHGATAWNDSGRIQGLADIPLSPAGRRQVERLARRLAREVPTLVASSPLRRARETAEAVAAAAGVPLRVVAELREMDFGAWDGLTVDQVRTQDPENWRRVVAGEDWPNGGSGERASQVQLRVRAAVDELRAADPEGRVVVVSHLAALRALLCALAGRELTLRWPLLDPAGITEIAWPTQGPPAIVSMNETSHLYE